MMPLLVCLGFALLLLLAACFTALATVFQTLREGGGGEEPRGSSMLLHDPGSRLAEVLLLSTITNLLLVAAGLWLVLNPWTAAGWHPWLGAVVLAGVVLFFAVALPGACALRAPQRALRTALPVFALLRFLGVLPARIMRGLSERITAAFTPARLKPRKAMLVEEVQTLIDMREEQGGVDADEAALLRSLVNLQGLIAKDAMTPRVDLPLMPHDARDDEAVNMLETARHRFVAVFDEKADAIAWLLDVERWKLAGRPHWSTLTTAPVFIPETFSLLDAWREHLHDDSCAVVAVDEYGGFEGLLTRASLVSLVLAKAAPAPDTSGGIQPIGPDRYLVAGSTRIDEIERELEVSLKAGNVDTIGGLVLNHFGYPPKPGEKLTVGPLDIKVKRTSRARVQQLELHVLETHAGEGGT